MKPLLFALPGNELLAERLSQKMPAELGQMTLRKFPDGETYLCLLTEVAGRHVVLISSLDRPDEKMIPLWLLAKTAKAQGAKKVTLLSPYLPYMRQDKTFHPGESISARHFAELVSSMVDNMVTVDPHLHRINRLEEIYSIPTTVLHAAQPIAKWIKTQVEKPVLIGPDSESKQWVSEVAEKAGAPYLVLEKKRFGDRQVEVSVPQLAPFRNHTPVLVDDIISTAHTMIKAVEHLRQAGAKPPVCIGVHAVFAGPAFEELKAAGAGRIVTCDTILHSSNLIDLSDLYVPVISNS
jgi:ribose-phosphate pyrophosphokinase